MPEIFPKVIQTLAGDNFTVYAYMLDGTVRLLDVSELVRRGGIFERLKDRDFFENALTVLNDTVAWDLSGCLDASECIDIDPFTVAECPIISDPLKTA